jgi:phosphoserine phosphatase
MEIATTSGGGDVRVATLAAIVIALVACLGLSGRAQTDPLPAWAEGTAKRAIVEFVGRVTKEGGPDFVPVADRIATFDNDGTLWVEKPLPTEVYFVLARVRELAARDPALKSRQPFKAALEGDAAYFHEQGPKAIIELLLKTHTGMSQEEFASDVERFFSAAQHPTLHRAFSQTAYEPMTELLGYLQANGFETWICSGGTTDFMRVIAPRIYNIAPDRILGSDIKRDSRVVDGRRMIWRLPEVTVLNDKEVKPVSIDRGIGKRPILAAGNVGNAGDIAMMEYSHGRPGLSLQLLVNHDDAAREFAYAEKDRFSLDAAAREGFTTVSIRSDWKTVLAPVR